MPRARERPDEFRAPHGRRPRGHRAPRAAPAHPRRPRIPATRRFPDGGDRKGRGAGHRVAAATSHPSRGADSRPARLRRRAARPSEHDQGQRTGLDRPSRLPEGRGPSRLGAQDPGLPRSRRRARDEGTAFDSERDPPRPSPRRAGPHWRGPPGEPRRDNPSLGGAGNERRGQGAEHAKWRKRSCVMDNLNLIILGVVIVIVILALRAIIHIVPEYQRLIVFRLGSFEKTAGPGIVLLLPPPIQSVAQTVDLREFVVEIPQQTCITKDNAPISIDFLIYQKVVEPKDSFLNIQNFRQAIQGIATTTLRAVVGNIPLDDVLAKREQINEELRVKLDDITHRWGVKVTNVEIKELTPPRDVQEAMNRQLTAERTRRASVTEAEGKKASAILVADGAKQAAILEAEGARQSAILRAEGFALALSTINAQAMNADARTMTLQYFNTLNQLGASPATKFIIPTEFTSLAGPLAGLMAARGDGGDERKK